MHSQKFTARELINIVSHRDNIITVYLTTAIVGYLVSRAVSSLEALLVLQLAVWAIIGVAFYLFAVAMKESNAWWALVAGFIPLVNLFMVFRLRSKATNLLKEHGVSISKAFEMRNQIRKMAITGTPVLLMLLACASLFSADTAEKLTSHAMCGSPTGLVQCKGNFGICNVCTNCNSCSWCKIPGRFCSACR